MMNKRVIVAMSGGVDSSVAALLLKEQGYDVVGVTMRLWSTENASSNANNNRCCSVKDVDDARRVCQIIGIPHYLQNFEREFQEHVVNYFVREYSNGRTPHPCLACNDKIKFDFLLRRAMFLDANYIATGHYARIQQNGKGLKLLKGTDYTKDQSYVLFTLKQAELSRLLMPIGNYSKTQIREFAEKANLPIAKKPDSQEICFIPDNDYRKFVSKRSKIKPGNIVNTSGTILGQHPGIQFFTVGQRRGIGLNGNSEKPMYVLEIDTENNQVVAGPEDKLFRSTHWASKVNFISGQIPQKPIEVKAKIRYKATECPATVIPNGDFAEIRFHTPQRAVTPGQAVVFYQDEELIGGGIIELKSSPVEAMGI